MSENNIMLTAEAGAALAPVVEQMMRPFMEHMVKLVAANTEALEQIAGQSAVLADRLEALEKEVRLGRKVTGTQKRYINDAMNDRAKEVLDPYGITDRKAVQGVARMIRKSVLSRLGIASAAEIPSFEYSVVMDQIASWNDRLKVYGFANEYRRKEENNGLE